MVLGWNCVHGDVSVLKQDLYTFKDPNGVVLVFSSFYGVTWCLCNTVTIMSQKVKDLMLLLYENAYSALFLSFYFSSVNRTAGTSWTQLLLYFIWTFKGFHALMIQFFLYVNWTLHFCICHGYPSYLWQIKITFLCPNEISLSRLNPFLKVTQLSGVCHVGLRTGLFLPLHCWGSYVTLGHLKVYQSQI